jgi:hypothetical protein
MKPHSEMSAGMYTSKYQALSFILQLKDPIHIDTNNETRIMTLCNNADCDVHVTFQLIVQYYGFNAFISMPSLAKICCGFFKRDKKYI